MVEPGLDHSLPMPTVLPSELQEDREVAIKLGGAKVDPRLSHGENRTAV